MREPDSDAGMTPEELRLYREILQSAYPRPKRDIKAGVMDAIRSEAVPQDGKAKILMPAENKAAKKSRRDLFLKWGSLAASIVIVAGIGIRVLPAFLSKDIVTSDNNAMEAAYDMAPQETAASEMPGTAAETSENSGEAGLYKTMLTDAKSGGTAIAEEVPEEVLEEAVEAEAEEVSAEEAVPEEAEAPMAVAEEPAAEEAVAEEDYDEAPVEKAADAVLYSFSGVQDVPADGTSAAEETAPAILCSHENVFRNSYHEIPAYLIDEVGEDEYNAWANEISKEDSCAVNIYNFLQHFGISETTFVMYLQNSDIAYYCDYPVDILYGWEPEEIDGYYRGGGRCDEMTADYFEYEFKLALVKEIGVSAYTEWLGNFVSETVRAWSISQFVRDHGITEARFLEIYDETADAFLEEYEGCVIPEYDTAKVFVPSAEIQLALSMSASGYQADVLCRK